MSKNENSIDMELDVIENKFFENQRTKKVVSNK